MIVRSQSPLVIAGSSVPELDIAVVRGTIRDFAQEHPTSAALVVEISDAALHLCRPRKASLYAMGEITDYWLLSLRERQLEVYRDPVPSPDLPFGYGYQTPMVVAANGEIGPLAAPDKPVKAADLLP